MMACLLIVVLRVMAGCTGASKATPKSMDQPRDEPSHILAETAAWRTNQTATGRVVLRRKVALDLLGDEIETIVVPSSAVVSRARKPFCVKRTGDSWQAVDVSVVDSAGAGRTFIPNGLKPGDDRIAEGTYGIICCGFRELPTLGD